MTSSRKYVLSEQNITHQATTTDGLPDQTSTGVKERESCLHLHLVEKPQTILLHREKMEDPRRKKKDVWKIISGV